MKSKALSLKEWTECWGAAVSKMYECFHCGCRSVVWDGDFMAEEFGYAENGIVHICHCANCDAEIQYFIRIMP